MGVAEMIAKAKAREEAAKKEKAAANTPKSSGKASAIAARMATMARAWQPATGRGRYLCA